jgi:hypothetical protein
MEPEVSFPCAQETEMYPVHIEKFHILKIL